MKSNNLRNMIIGGLIGSAIGLSALVAGNAYSKPNEDGTERVYTEDRAYPEEKATQNTEFYEKMQIATGEYVMPSVNAEQMQLVNPNDACPLDKLYCRGREGSNAYQITLNDNTGLELKLDGSNGEPQSNSPFYIPTNSLSEPVFDTENKDKKIEIKIPYSWEDLTQDYEKKVKDDFEKMKWKNDETGSYLKIGCIELQKIDVGYGISGPGIGVDILCLFR